MKELTTIQARLLALQDEAYRAYVARTPIILPLVPLYHLENVKFIVV